MEDFCPCCGVRFNENQIGVFDGSNNGEEYDHSKHNFKYSTNSKSMCWWCANCIPCGLIDVIYGIRKDYNEKWTKENFREYYMVAERIEELSKLKIEKVSCPRCGGELKEKFSIGLGEMIKKCNSCGWC